MPYKEHITIVVDTREQKPLNFSRYKDIDTVAKCLKVGDYSGVLHTKYGELRSRTVYDRKENDIWGTFATKDGHRCIKERLADSHMTGAVLVIAFNYPLVDIRDGQGGGVYKKSGAGLCMSKFTGSSMVALLKTMYKRHGLRLLFCNGRTDMKLHIVSDYMAELKYCNELLKLFDKSGDFRLLDIVNRFCYLWED